jgi:hypothetical protein
MNNNKGMDLSVNMLVVIIIAILVLGMGMTIMYQVFEQSGKLTNQLSAQQEQALKQLVISGEKVAVYPIVQDAEGRQGVFGVGIKNVVGSLETFTINVTCENYFPDETIEQGCTGNWDYEFAESSVTIPNNEEVYKSFLISNEESPSGKYSFKLTVTKSDTSTYYYPILFFLNLA